MNPSQRNHHEMAKNAPACYPSNTDSIGIELVGKSTPAIRPKQPATYEAVTKEQNASLAWLVAGLAAALKIKTTEVFRHPTASQKTPSEASTAQW